MTTFLRVFIIESLNEYKGWVEDAGETLDFTNVDYDELERDVQEEIDSGDDRPIIDIIIDLIYKLGCKHYGIK